LPSRSLVFGLFERRRIGQLSRSQGPLQRDNGLAKPGGILAQPLYCDAQSISLTRRPLADQGKRSRQRGVSVPWGHGVVEISKHGSAQRLGPADLIFRMPKVDVVSLGGRLRIDRPMRASCDYFFARASSANLTNILRNSPGPVTRSGKSSRKVLAPACRSIPSGSHPVQRQSSGAAPSSLVA
jgi:hypothetical protein